MDQLPQGQGQEHEGGGRGALSKKKKMAWLTEEVGRWRGGGERLVQRRSGGGWLRWVFGGLEGGPVTRDGGEGGCWRCVGAKKVWGRGGRKIGGTGGDAPFKGCDGEATRGGGGRGPAARMPRGVGRAWGLAPTDGRRPDRVPGDCGPAVACAGGAALFRAGVCRGY
jgi:hypothetical protein